MKLTELEIERYSTQLATAGFGPDEQLLLKKARILVVGAGGLGTPVLMYLNAMGIGSIGLIDNDTVELKNLHRQVLYSVEDIGKYKVDIARLKLNRSNPHTSIDTYPERLNQYNAAKLFEKYDLIIDGTDNFETKYLINDFAFRLGKPWIYGSIYQQEGQVAVFNHLKDGICGPNYRDLFPSPPPLGIREDCSINGVLGILPGIVGCFQANEAIKIITGYGVPLSGKLLVYDAGLNSVTILPVHPNHNNPLYRGTMNARSMQEDDAKLLDSKEEEYLIDISKISELIEQGEKPLLVDVRDPAEYDKMNLGGVNLPLYEIYNDSPSLYSFSQARTLILVCQTETRSKVAFRILKDQCADFITGRKIFVLKNGMTNLSPPGG